MIILAYKYVYQHNTNDCAVACLLSIIRYYKGNNTYENIHYLTHCDNNGVTALNLINASNKLGFESRGLKVEYAHLKNLKIPIIAHLILKDGYNHYVVVEKIKENTIYIFDPAKGKIKYKKEEFLKLWSNVVIELKPTRVLDVINEKEINLLTDIIKNNISTYLIVSFVSFLAIILTLVSNYYFSTLIKNSALSILIFFLFITFIKEINDYIRGLIIIKLESKIESDINKTTHEKLLLLPYYYFNSRTTGDIISKMQDLDYIKELIIKVPIYLLIDITLMVLSTIILLNISIKLYIIFLFVCLLYFLVLLLFDKKIKKLIRINQEDKIINNEILIENIKSINTIKNLNIESVRNDIFNQSYDSYLKDKKRYEKTINKELFIRNLIILMGLNIILYVGIKIVDLKELILFDSIAIYFLEAIKNICELNPLYKNAINALKRVKEIYKIDIPSYQKLEIDNFDIHINNLSYSYNGYKNIFKNLNLNILSKEKIAVTGFSGCGKSTLFKLINKTYQIENNKIFIGKTDINKINTSDIVSYISQEEILFKDTLYNNLTSYKNIKNETVMKISKITGLDKVIKSKNMNLNSFILEDGINFSKGEKQKIILTRVLLKNNNILILDEALNALDESEECKILNRIIKCYRNKTIIYITHRKKCISLFDREIKLKGEV